LAPSGTPRGPCWSSDAGADPATSPLSLHDALPISVARLSLVEARPLTGRTHQIRVHLAESRWPVVGDEIYGRGRDGFKLGLRAVDRKSTRLNSSHVAISYAVFCLQKNTPRPAAPAR